MTRLGTTRLLTRLFKGRLLLTLAMMALGMNAFIPAGYMVAPSSSHLFAVTMCPQTNPLARAVANVQSHAQAGEMASVHAAMGHHVSAPDDETPAAGRGDVDCAFSALAAAGDIPEQPQFIFSLIEASLASAIPLPALVITHESNLRPPLRGPPSRG